jgi:hypothetical protein
MTDLIDWDQVLVGGNGLHQGGPNDCHRQIAEWTRYGALDGAAP